MLAVYIHIPFCERKCNYCAFSSFACIDKEKDRYISSLLNEIENFDFKNFEFNSNLLCVNRTKTTSYEVDTIYIGGGTPSLLTIEDLTKILNKIKEKFKISSNCEISIECNPNSLTYEKACGYKNLGINRVSLGIQSLDDEELKFIGRLHNSSQALDAIDMVKKAGIKNISCDMIIGLQNQTPETFKNQLETLIKKDIKHISTYMLQIEDGTPLAKFASHNADFLPSEDENAFVYKQASAFLEEHGFKRYEVSNFAKLGYESRHNFKYWTGENYIGFGLSAHSYIDGIRYANANNFADYYSRKLALKETLSKQELIEEHLMLGLRCARGVDLEYLQKLGKNIENNENFKYFLEKNVIFKVKNKFFLNPDYYEVNNYVIVKLMS